MSTCPTIPTIPTIRDIRLTTALALAIAVSATACTKDAGSAGSSAISSEWKHLSADGKVEIVQELVSAVGGTPACRVHARSTQDDKILWRGTACIPAPSDLVFVSAGGEKLLILNLFPAAGVQSPDWSDISLAQFWVKGKVERHYKGSEILAADRASDMRRFFSWVRGETLEQVRGSARAVAAGTQVSIDLADGRTITLGFEGALPPTPPALSPIHRPAEVAVAPEPQPAPAQEAPAPPRTSAAPEALVDGDIYRWEDDAGEVHFTTGSAVPAKYMRRARRLQGSVGVVPMEVPGVVTSTGQPGAAQPAQPAPAPDGSAGKGPSRPH